MKIKDKSIYTEDSIRSIDPRTFTRMKPGVYCGSTDYSTQLLKELLTNAIDEVLIGHGNKIEVGINTKLNMYTIADNGQGFPVNVVREDGLTILEAAYSKLNTSGKYDEEGVYNGTSNGAFGIGGKLSNFLSKQFAVCTTTGSGIAEQIKFKDGIFIERKLLDVQSKRSGTSIQFTPDPQFFKNAEVDLKEIRKYFKEIVCLCKDFNLEICLHVDEKKEVFISKRGLTELLDEIVDKKEIISNRFISSIAKNNLKFDICLTYTSDYSDNLTAYVNYGKTDSGVHITAFKTNLTRTLNRFANENKIFKKNESNLTGAELNEGLVVIFNVCAPNVGYDGQTKTRVTDIDKTLISESITNDFYNWLCLNPKDAQKIIEKALESRRAREAAKKARESVRKPIAKKGLKAKMEISEKLSDCSSKKREDCELLVVEGDSAGGAAKQARDPKTQAVMALRGKVINVQKITLEKALENKEIQNIIMGIGAGFGKDFDIKKARYRKIIIMTDADVDGE